jgi:hypothetical protein
MHKKIKLKIYLGGKQDHPISVRSQGINKTQIPEQKDKPANKKDQFFTKNKKKLILLIISMISNIILIIPTIYVINRMYTCCESLSFTNGIICAPVAENHNSSIKCLGGMIYFNGSCECSITNYWNGSICSRLSIL